MGRILATGARVPHIEVFDDIYAARMNAVDIGQCMPNLVDLVNESALIWLASQFGILGDKGYNAATTVTERREIIKRAVEIQRYKGTPYAIKQAILALGYTDVIITEGVAGPVAQYDGVPKYDGVYQYGLLTLGNAWATFTVEMFSDFTPSPAQVAQLTRLINENKNVRSQLVGLINTVTP